MPRPKKMRCVEIEPEVVFFKPRSIPLRMLELVQLGMDEVEALRLSDFEGLSQESAAEKMAVSRATFGRIVASARYKVADALIHGKAISIESSDLAGVHPKE